VTRPGGRRLVARRGSRYHRNVLPSGVRIAPRALLLIGLAFFASACGPKYARVRVVDERDLKVTLRALVENGERVQMGYEHPVTIASVRLANILSTIDVRKSEEDQSSREHAFETSLVYRVGGELSKALAQADPSQTVVVQAVRKDKRLGIFTRRKLTSFTAWMLEDRLYLHFNRVNWEVPKGDEDGLPEPYPDRVAQQFRVIGTEGVIPVGQQVVAVDWRSPEFRRSAHVRVGPGGKLVRKNILLEAPPETDDDVDPAPPELSGDLSPGLLRTLADLQEQRQNGEISEALYHARRREILQRAASGLPIAEEPPEAAPEP